MSNQDNLNNANELGRTIALLIANPYGQSTEVVSTVNNLVGALAAKAHDLLNPPALKASTASDTTDIVLGHAFGPSRFESLDMVRYLSAAAKNGQIDHSLRCVTSGNGKAEFYIHPANGDGQTVQFIASTSRIEA